MSSPDVTQGFPDRPIYSEPILPPKSSPGSRILFPMESTYDLRKVWASSFLIAPWSQALAEAAFVISSLADKTYTAEAQVVVTAGLGTDARNGDVLTAPRIGQTYATLAMTRPVLLEVIRRADLPYDRRTRAARARLGRPGSPFIVIAATDRNPNRAEQTANALAHVLVERATVLTTPGSAEVTILEIVERAVVPDEPSGPA